MTKENKEENIGKEFKRLLTYTFKHKIDIKKKIKKERKITINPQDLLDELEEISQELNLSIKNSKVLRELDEKYPSFRFTVKVEVWDEILKPLYFSS